jgi:periplasmic copper chaperone A
VTSRLVRALLAMLATTAAVLAFGIGTASAHVTAGSTDAAAGGFGEITLRVPNERPDSSTVSLRVQLPTDTPLAFVSVKPVPGWTATTETTPLDPPVDVEGSEISEAVSQITWTADTPEAAIAPGEYLPFSISGGPLPEAGSLTLPAVQTYSSGEEVAWIEPSVEGEPEPEHPAPVLTLAAAETGASDTPATTPAADSTDEGTSGVAGTALVVGIAGLLAGLAGLVLALGGRRRSASPTAAHRERPRVSV